MRLRFGTAFFAIFFIIFGCQKSEQFHAEFSENTVNAHSAVPRFDSINWSKAYAFQKLKDSELREKTDYLKHYFQNYWVQKNASGGFLVAVHGQILFEGYNGFADFEKQIPITPETPIHLASISKVLTALAVLKLVESKRIRLDDEVSEYLMGFPYPEVTIKDLLNHRSGLPNYLHFTDDANIWDQTKMLGNKDVLDILIHHKPEPSGLPGKRFSYNNTNYVLLALIVENTTGLTFHDAMEYMIFKPLGMNHTFVFEYEKDSAKVSKSYYNNGRIWDFNFLDKTYGDKNIYSTPRDLFKLDQAMYSEQFLSKSLKEKAWKGYSYEAKGYKNYGLGIRLIEWDSGEKILYHKGWWHGNYTSYTRDFRDEAVIIALGNKKDRIVYESFDLISLFGNFPNSALPETVLASNFSKENAETSENTSEEELPGGAEKNIRAIVNKNEQPQRQESTFYRKKRKER